MVVGPPGTGKTDTAVQIITNLYHNYPTQKILLVTHSNAALNDLFEKIMEVSLRSPSIYMLILTSPLKFTFKSYSALFFLNNYPFS